MEKILAFHPMRFLENEEEVDDLIFFIDFISDLVQQSKQT